MKNPGLWWKHVGGCIVQEIGRVCSKRRFIKRVGHRRAMRQQYDKHYQKYRQLKGWRRFLSPIFGSKRSALDELEILEENLSTVEVAEFRWWTWTHFQKKNKKKRDSIARKLIEIYNILSVDSVVKESTKKWKFEVSVECPKAPLTPFMYFPLHLVSL